MFRFLNLLLLFCFINNIGTATKPVRGIKGGSVTLSCGNEDREIEHIDLSSQTENIEVCETEECSGRVIKEGTCDVIIKDLRLSDAGTYFLIFYYNIDESKLEQQIRKYQLHFQDEVSVKAGDELKLDVLLFNANKVERNMNGEWMEVWRSDNGVSSDRMTVRDGNLIIKSFKATDAGTYRVLDYEDELLITVTVTESNDETAESEEPAVRFWIRVLAVGMLVFMVGIAIPFMVGIFKKGVKEN